MKALALFAVLPASWAALFLTLHWHGQWDNTRKRRYQVGAALLGIAGPGLTFFVFRWAAT